MYCNGSNFNETDFTYALLFFPSFYKCFQCMLFGGLKKGVVFYKQLLGTLEEEVFCLRLNSFKLLEIISVVGRRTSFGVTCHF